MSLRKTLKTNRIIIQLLRACLNALTYTYLYIVRAQLLLWYDSVIFS